jgi:hypothetical protein
VTTQETPWTPLRRDIREWLYKTAPSLGELYEGAVWLAYGPRLPGRVRFIGHAVREIGNALPAAMSEAVRRGALAYKERLDQVAKTWEHYGYPLDGTLPTATTPEVPMPDIALPRPLVEQIAVLLGDHRGVRLKRDEAAVHLFEACIPADQFTPEWVMPVIDQWLGVISWFMSRTHDSGTPDAAHEAEVPGQFELFETILGTLSREFFATMEGIDAILADANA